MRSMVEGAASRRIACGEPPPPRRFAPWSPSPFRGGMRHLLSPAFTCSPTCSITCSPPA